MYGEESWIDALPYLVAIVGILTPTAIVGLICYYIHRNRREVQATMRAAIEKGQELPAEFLQSISKPKAKKAQPTQDQDLRRGIVLAAIGLGIGTFGFLVGEDEAVGPLMGIGSIPLLIGLGLTLLWALRSRHEK